MGVQVMERRKWADRQKFQIVLEGLSGQISITELCNKYQVSQTQYYKWRDQFLRHGDKIFSAKNTTKREAKMAEEVRRLKTIIGDLTIELKKTEIELRQ
jgi:transposase-like protein